MNKDDLIILLLVVVLLLAAILTIIRGGAQSKHGYGELSVPSSGSLFAAFAAERFDKCRKVDSTRHRV